ncbi:hypothetical protein SAMN05216532_3989 [Streptomyces sp. 2231.1]|uniref:hypothetical protein n=1 Tax=Streptomyces sp. 2231.1 TaxID=1855347 RepID=UPI00089836BE|nr:hypothetical protein [Streptomyces sp. 2231.1]SED26282.1 hypothetical protein SAMN05216532_3989 [Streptomyces sp. 2231.1]
MTDNEIQILICGASYGAVLTTWLHAFWNARDDRRDLEASRLARRRAAADRYYSSLRLYQLQRRTGTR